ncbi:MAG: hypothetical protein CSA58_07930 [Micrococcales bacterium]|nr:MAG: hypothetical protein CSB46_09190 [Micrococcales bacterium]PIE26804.1 MAG: hypothetical protein CSA58_07930 [Micrococcales bacterium]
MTATADHVVRQAEDGRPAGLLAFADVVSTAPFNTSENRESRSGSAISITAADDAHDDSNAGLLAAAARLRAQSNRAEVRLLETAVEFMIANPPQVLAAGGDTGADPWEGGILLAGPGSPLICGYALTEFVTAAGMSTAGEYLVRDALELAYRLPRTWELLRGESVQAWQARRLAARTTRLSKRAAAWVDVQCAPFLTRVGPSQLDRTVAEAVAKFDPEQANRDAENAAQRRGVWFGHAQPDPAVAGGVSELSGVLDHLDAITLDHALNAGAAALKAAGCTQSRDVRRAMTLGDLARTQATLPLDTAEANGGADWCDHGLRAFGEPLPDTQGPRLGPAETGPLPEVVTDAQLAGWRPHHDRDEPPARDEDIPAAFLPAPRPHCAVTVGETGFLVHLHLVATVRPDAQGPTITDGDDRRLGDWLLSPTGYLQRTGTAVTTSQIRDWLSRPDARVSVRPVVHTGTELSTDAYTPTEALAEQTRAKHPVCVFPFCTRPATSCDLDHRTPYPAGATTSSNLYPLCRRHHVVKTHRAWDYEPDPDSGGLIWYSPTGNLYHVDRYATTHLNPPPPLPDAEEDPGPGPQTWTPRPDGPARPPRPDPPPLE